MKPFTFVYGKITSHHKFLQISVVNLKRAKRGPIRHNVNTKHTLFKHDSPRKENKKNNNSPLSKAYSLGMP